MLTLPMIIAEIAFRLSRFFSHAYTLLANLFLDAYSIDQEIVNEVDSIESNTATYLELSLILL